MTDTGGAPTLGDVAGVLDGLYDPAWARPWDAVGLVVGDPSAAVQKVLLAVDATPVVVEEALRWGADLLITHHPLLLRPVNAVAATGPKGRMVHELIRGGCALYTAHTNADAAAPGVSDALARVLGLRDLVPLEADAGDPMDKIVTFVPPAELDAVVDALTAAGAGAVGEYSRCAFSSAGEGTFVAGADARPVVGEPGARTTTAEHRLEMVAPRAARAAVLAALRAAHPYDRPVVDVLELASWSGPRGIGRVGTLAAPVSLRDLGLLVGEVLPATVQGVRIAGDPTAQVGRVAVCGGAGDSLFDAVRASGADVYVTADLRHHPALELRERAGEGPPFLVDVAHWASEWPWLAGVANRLAGALEGLGTPVETQVSVRCTDPWTLRLPSAGGVSR